MPGRIWAIKSSSDVTCSSSGRLSSETWISSRGNSSRVIRPKRGSRKAAAYALQEAHLAHLAKLRANGYRPAAGPLGDDQFRGLSILNVDPERVRELKETDPAVQAGRFSIK